jgi:hypothetical protein
VQHLPKIGQGSSPLITNIWNDGNFHQEYCCGRGGRFYRMCDQQTNILPSGAILILGKIPKKLWVVMEWTWSYKVFQE